MFHITAIRKRLVAAELFTTDGSGRVVCIRLTTMALVRLVILLATCAEVHNDERHLLFHFGLLQGGKRAT